MEIEVSGVRKQGGAKEMGPDLLIVGGQRCATTWLANVLRQHRNVWIPPIKELHYFDQQRKDADGKAFRRRYLGHLKKRLKHNARRVLRFRSPCWWDFRYFLQRRSDQWYCSLFRGAKKRGLLAGEATPAYALEGEDVYRTLLDWNPNLRVIFIMREPVSRLWSGVNNWSRKMRGNEASIEELIQRAEQPKVRERSEYWKTIERLEKVFPKQQIFYGFYDDLSDSPVEFVASVLRFLDVDDSVARRIVEEESAEGQRHGRPVPEEFRSRIEPYFRDGVSGLCARFGGAPCRWHEKYQDRLSQGG
jgi:hypothetical protein